MSLSKVQIDADLQVCMQELKKVDSEAYAELLMDEKKRNELSELMLEVINAENWLNSEFDTEEGKAMFEEIIAAMMEGLQVETFQVEVKKEESMESVVTFTRSGTPFLENMHLLSADDAEKAISYQAASILIEIIIVLLSLVKIKYHLSQTQLHEAIIKLQPYMKMIGGALRNLIFTWCLLPGLAAKAMAIVLFVKQVYHAGVLMKAIKIVISDMSWFGRLSAIGKITAFFLIVCRNPKSLVGRIDAVLKRGAMVFVKKITNLDEIYEIKHMLEPSLD